MTEETQDFSELEVPGEPGVYWCWRHRKVQTRLRCGRCEKPICPKCTRMGPTGARCVECVSNRTQHIYKVGPLHLAMTFFASAIFSIIAVPIMRGIGIFLLFFVPIIGTILGKGIVAVTRGKRGPILAWAATAGAVIGALAPVVPKILWFTRVSQMQAQLPPDIAPPPMPLGMSFLGDLGYVLIYLVIVIPALWYWIK